MDQLDLEKLGPFLECHTALVMRIMQQGAIAEATARQNGSLVYAPHLQPPAVPLPEIPSSPPALPAPRIAAAKAPAPSTQRPISNRLVSSAPVKAPHPTHHRLENLLAIAFVLLAFWYLGRFIKVEVLKTPPAPVPEVTEPPSALPPIPH